MGYFRMPFTLRETETKSRRERQTETDRDRELIQLPAVNFSHTSCHDFHNTYTCT